jgi:acyl carrier protein
MIDKCGEHDMQPISFTETVNELRVLLKELCQHLSEVDVIPIDADLRDCGVSSLDLVEILIGIENRLNIRVPDICINPENFRSIENIATMVAKLSTSLKGL